MQQTTWLDPRKGKTETQSLHAITASKDVVWATDTHKKKLIPRMPSGFFDPSRPGKPEDGTTTYLLPTGPGTLFKSIDQGPKVSDIKDGVSHTIMLDPL